MNIAITLIHQPLLPREKGSLLEVPLPRERDFRVRAERL
jgi:hypothetical protein